MDTDRSSTTNKPIHGFPMEALRGGLWWGVRKARIQQGRIMVDFDNESLQSEDVCLKRLRWRPRKALASDCGSFLKPGVEVSVFSLPPDRISMGRSSMAWYDAKITCIKRMPHQGRCTCRFIVTFCQKHDPPTSISYYEKKTAEISICHIRILQKLRTRPYNMNIFQKEGFEDVSVLRRGKLSSGNWRLEVPWLVVISALKGMNFDLKLNQNKLIYIISNNSEGSHAGNVRGISFYWSGGMLKPNFETFSEDILEEKVTFPTQIICTNEAKLNKGSNPIDIICIDDGDNYESCYDFIGLRRSKRQRNSPDWFARYGVDEGDNFQRKKSTHFETCIDGRVQENFDKDTVILTPTHKTLESDIYPEFVSQSEDTGVSTGACFSTCYDRVNLDQPESQREMTESHLVSYAAGSLQSNYHGLPKCSQNIVPDVVYKAIFDEKGNQKSYADDITILSRDHKDITEDVHAFTCGSFMPVSEHSPGTEVSGRRHECDPRVSSREFIEGQVKVTAGNHRTNDLLNHQKTMKSTKPIGEKHTNIEFDMREALEGVTYSTLRKKKGRRNRPSGMPNYPIYRESHSMKRMTNNDILLEYKKRLEDLVQDAASEQENLRASFNAPVMEEGRVFQWPSTPTEVETSDPPEYDSLWEQLEQISSEVPFPLVNQESNFKFSDNVEDISPASCQHIYVLDDEIGIICQLCKIVVMEIRYILPPPNPLWNQHKESTDDICKMKINKSRKPYAKPFERANFSTKVDISDSSEDAWSLIPDLTSKLHIHQQKAFEFIWQNVAGSVIMREMDSSCDRAGGCIISHSPGTGKTLLVIAFLKSYLSLFPGCKPLILVPKVTLYTWAREFEKWNSSIPVHEILATDDYRNMNSNDAKACCGLVGQAKLPVHLMRIVDCLQKIQKWHEKPSILLTSYSCFSSFTNARTDSEWNGYIAEMLLKSPGILVLDEGHKPRSTNSILRKTLMNVETDLRILLSGTLFQNNFEEYFNSLSLARPAFIEDVLNEFEATTSIGKHLSRPHSGRPRVLAKEKIARNIFMEEIASLINSEEEEDRKYGLDKLRTMTNSFIDVYEGRLLEKLPGLETYTILVKPTPLQQRILCKLEALENKWSLEIEPIITAAAIHAWLVKTLANSGQFLSERDLDIDKYRTDITHGSKLQFVVDLVRHCIHQKEKVLIFCRYIPPIDLLVEIFVNIFQWQKGKEVLVLQGKQDTLDRSIIMDKFSERGGCAQVLLASTTACSEGINLTAASRLVLLDSEWNPSKTKQAIARAFRLGQEKVVYVYRLLASETLEEEKHEKTAWKEQLSRMVFRCEDTGGSSYKQTEHIEDDILRMLVEDDRTKMFHSIMKHDNFVKSTDQVTL